MRTALLIARKDLRERLRDRSAFLYGIVAPLGLAAIFGFVFNPIQSQTFNAEYVIVDQDGGTVGQALTQALEGLEDDDVATIRSVSTLEQAEEQVETGSDAFAGDEDPKADAAFVIPEGLSDAVLAGEGGQITVIGAAGSSLAAQIAYSVADGFASELGAVEVAVRTALPQTEPGDPAAVGVLAGRAAQTESPISVEDVTAATRQLDQTTYLAAAMAVFFLFFTVSFGVSGILEERRIGTMKRLLAAPISRTSILAGKALTSFVLGIVSMTVLYVATTLLLGAKWGHPAGVGMLIVAAVIAAMGILAVVAAFAKTQDQASNMQAILAMGLALLGGAFFSVSQIGGPLEALSLLTPHAWFLRGLADLTSGDATDVLPSVGALLAFGLVTGGLAWVFMRRKVEL